MWLFLGPYGNIASAPVERPKETLGTAIMTLLMALDRKSENVCALVAWDFPCLFRTDIIGHYYPRNGAPPKRIGCKRYICTRDADLS